MRKKLLLIGLCLFVIISISNITAKTRGYTRVLKQPRFLCEAIMNIHGSDLDNNQKGEIVLLGKNYIKRETYTYLIETNDQFKPIVKWQSPNLFQKRGFVGIALGKFTGEKKQLLVVNESGYYIYETGKNGKLALLTKREFAFQKTLNITSGDLDGDGRTELIIAKIGQITSKIYNGRLQIWQILKTGPELIFETKLLGNIRGVAAGDINGDSQDEVIIEEGNKMNPGNLRVFSWENQQLRESYSLKNSIKKAVFGLKIKKIFEKEGLVTASSHGKLNFFSWNEEMLKLEKEKYSFRCGLVDVAVSDLNGDSQPEIILAGYPNSLIVLSKK